MAVTLDGYTAIRNEDGTLTVKDVPIFLECFRKPKDPESEFDGAYDDEWIRMAVADAKQAEKDNHYRPLHVAHHGSMDGVRRAGFFRVTGAKMMRYKGERKLAIFADLTFTDPGAEADLLSKRLPYRSVEIHDPMTPAINSLALLDHQAPFLELPMLMVSAVQEGGQSVADATFDEPWLMEAMPEDSAALVCFQHGNGVHLLFRAEEAMASKTEKSTATPPQKPEHEAAEEAKKPTQPELFMDENKPPMPPNDTPTEDKPEESEESDEDQEAEDDDCRALATKVVEKITSGAMPGSCLEMIKAAITGMEKAPPEAEDKPDQPQQVPQPQPMPNVAPGGQAMEADKKDSEQFAALQGKVDALELKDKERDASDQRREDVAAALDRLKGRPLGSDFKQRLEAFHKEHGPKAFKDYVESFVHNLGPLPRLAGADVFTNEDGEFPEVAMRYQEAGPENVTKAAQFCADYRQLAEHGVVTMPEERYVELQMQDIGVTLKKKQTA